MLIEQMMNRHVVTIQPTNTIAHAAKLMRDNKVRHLIVTNPARQVVGIIGQFEMSGATSVFHPESESADFQNPVSSIMRQDVTTAHPYDFFEDAAALFYEYRLTCLPIIEQGKLVGVLTETDLLRYFVQLTGALEPSSQIEILVENTTGTLEKVTRLLAKTNINIINVFVHPTADPYKRIISFRVQTMNPLRIIERLKREGFDVLGPEMSP
ncbi:acetoin utilization AcuB family protein [Exiguobacterium aurantiacum]|uniref:Putative manganese-dependent inorganic pyrophosphatase n=1 Tax=Exiguobacterium aurantiacum TaxID=33987 RepID=A0A377FSD0_9BACL|nr:acetoin utilization AcuB family protein [Exiguobacterium aurantiacum]STO07712.1 putative manganese-dependent inorganic pyrophosphatase [Exiguobacterium aurantiacum]